LEVLTAIEAGRAGLEKIQRECDEPTSAARSLRVRVGDARIKRQYRR